MDKSFFTENVNVLLSGNEASRFFMQALNPIQLKELDKWIDDEQCRINPAFIGKNQYMAVETVEQLYDYLMNYCEA
jgi:hypothetical protein